MLTTKKFDQLPHPNTLNVFLGNMLQLRKERINFFINQQKILGDIYQVKIPTRKVVVLTDPEWIKYVLVDNNKNYGKSFAYDSIKLFLGNGLLTSEGEFWKRQRRLAQPAFHKEKLALMFQNMVEQTNKCIQSLEKQADTNQPVNLSSELYKLTLDIVNSTLFYNEVDNTTDKIYKLVSEGNEHITRRVDNPLQLPEWIPTPNRIKEKQVLKSMDDVFFSVIENRRKQNVQHEDLLSMLMDARDEETGEGMSNRQLRDEILTIFVAGHETTQIALGWTFYLLTQHPDKLKILMDEIDRELKEYFAGKLQKFTTNVAFTGSEFQCRAWNALREIKYGSTVNYGEHSLKAGAAKSARAIAGANAANPLVIIIPCHRVINSNGSIGGYSGGIERKRFLLKLESSH